MISTVNLAAQILQGVVTGQAANQPLSLISYGIEFLSLAKSASGSQKKAVLIAALEHLAKGADGVYGTADDILSPAVLGGLKALIESDLLPGLIDIAYAAAKWKVSWWRTYCYQLPCCPK